MSRRRAPVVAGAVGAVLVALLVLLAVADPSTDSASSPLLGRAAPAVRSETLDGAPFELARRKGSWVVLNFFNSTCVPCRNEHPNLVAFAEGQASADDPVELYTVVNDDSDTAVKAFFDANGGDWPRIRDDDGAVAVAFGVAKVPETWVIDANGFVRLRVIGEISRGFLEDKIGAMKSADAGTSGS
ncbi:MAG: cytochrome c biosis protein CcmG [Actinomycetota bacterium]|jgi:cytochrome c biogenesis protein CcmG/thiol:disulfide interchange protein DsbE